MDLVTVHLHFGGEVHDRSVHTDLGVSLFAELVEELAIMPFTSANDGGKDYDLFTGVVFQYILMDLVFSVLDHFLTGDIGVGFAGAGKKEAHKVIDLRDRTDSGAGVPAGGFLFDADDRAESVDLFYIRSLNASQKLAGVCGECFQIAALTFGVNGIEGKRRFAAAADACDDDQFFTGNAEVDGPEVVFFSTGDFDPAVFGGKIICCCFQCFLSSHCPCPERVDGCVLTFLLLYHPFDVSLLSLFSL